MRLPTVSLLITGHVHCYQETRAASFVQLYDLCAEERSANSRNSSDAALNRARVEQLEFSGWLARLDARCMNGPSSTTTANFRHFVGLPA